jgi:hypothetical protein
MSTGGIGKGKETKNLNVVDVLTAEERIILNWQRPLCEGDQEVVKRSAEMNQCGLQYTST